MATTAMMAMRRERLCQAPRIPAASFERQLDLQPVPSKNSAMCLRSMSGTPSRAARSMSAWWLTKPQNCGSRNETLWNV
jgi:hypothetical protein